MSDQSKAPGERIGPYQLTRKLGRGGMGEVWLAHDTVLKRDVAVKLLPEEVTRNERAVKRFLREARSAAKLNHPNVMTIHQIGKYRERIFIVMELVEGGSLADELKRSGGLDWREATRAVREAAAGLAAAHEVGLVHRDIKPSNLMRTAKGQVKVVDFGLARAQKETLEVTRPGGVIGTPAFIAPEQGRGRKVDARSDLYSLTCSYYALLTGRVPFEGDSSSAVIYQHVHEPFPDARQTVSDLPEAVCRILDRGTRKTPLDRYQSAEEMIADLDRVQAGIEDYVGGVEAWGVPSDTGRPSDRPSRFHSASQADDAEVIDRARRNRMVAMLVVGVGVLVVLAAVLLVVFWPGPRPGPGPKPRRASPRRSRDWILTPEEAARKQREAAAVWSTPVESSLDLGGVTLKLALIPTGFFEMGSAGAKLGWHKDQSPPHEVVITQPFYIGVTEVTQGQWKAVMATEPPFGPEALDGWKGRPESPAAHQHPASVSWQDAVAFCRAVSTKTQQAVRLPTEAEWEYACRAGSDGDYCFDESAEELGAYAWYDANTEADGKGHPMGVGLKKPNAWGLYDVHGNVWEWCSDRYAEDYYAHSERADPQGPDAGDYRILRGGSWNDPPGAVRSAFRMGTNSDVPIPNSGFRVVCVVKRNGS